MDLSQKFQGFGQANLHAIERCRHRGDLVLSPHGQRSGCRFALAGKIGSIRDEPQRSDHDEINARVQRSDLAADY